jgi:hypothetical protein
LLYLRSSQRSALQKCSIRVPDAVQRGTST